MQISSINKSLGTLSLVNFARKHTERLAAHSDDDVKAQAARVVAAVTGLENAYAACRPLLALWSAAADAKNAADDALDEAIRALSYDLLGPSHLNKDRSAAAYRVLFPSGNLDFIGGPDRAQLAHVRAMVTFLQAHADHPMANRAPALASKAAALEDALEAATTAQAQFRAAEVTEREHRATLGRALKKSVWFLRDFFDGDEAKVDALFVDPTSAKVEEPPQLDLPL